MDLNVDACIEKLKKGELLSEHTVKSVFFVLVFSFSPFMLLHFSGLFVKSSKRYLVKVAFLAFLSLAVCHSLFYCSWSLVVLVPESNIQPVHVPVTVVGDVHGFVLKRRQPSAVHLVPSVYLLCSSSDNSVMYWRCSLLEVIHPSRITFCMLTTGSCFALCSLLAMATCFFRLFLLFAHLSIHFLCVSSLEL